jgi:uncharacterized damage-inducible protein DinB
MPTPEVTMQPTFVERYRRWFACEKDMHRKVLESLETVPEENRAYEPYRKALDLMGHIAAARRTWLHRLDPAIERPAAIFPVDVTIETLRPELDAVERAWTDYLERLTDEDTARVATYATSEGTWYRTAIADILMQTYGHSLYHRGQIATLVRAAGGQPAATDFIFWVRETAEPPGESQHP